MKMNGWFMLLTCFCTLGVLNCGTDQEAKQAGSDRSNMASDATPSNYMVQKTVVKKEIDVDALQATMKDFHGIDYVLIRPGEFNMGSEMGDADEVPVHTVQIKDPFYMGKYEVTQKQWESIMGHNPSHFRGADLPVETVSWDDVQSFIMKLNKFEKGNFYRLPTEEEWEYACLAGTADANIARLNEIGWHEGNAKERSHPVGQKRPNAWGLYDMFGNVWEWCHNAYEPYAGSDWVMGPSFRVIDGGHATNNIVNDSKVIVRVFRGGSWKVPPRLISAADREKRNAEYKFDNVGFRLIKVVR